MPVKLTSSLAVSSSHKGGPLSMLSLVGITSEASGNYTCVARNAAGVDEFSAYLTVIGMAALAYSWAGCGCVKFSAEDGV